MTDYVVSAHAFVGAMRLCAVTAGRRRFSLERRRIDSDPPQPPLWIETMGLFPLGMGTRPPVRTNPRRDIVDCGLLP
jgi:hypothetical protein